MHIPDHLEERAEIIRTQLAAEHQPQHAKAIKDLTLAAMFEKAETIQGMLVGYFDELHEDAAMAFSPRARKGQMQILFSAKPDPVNTLLVPDTQQNRDMQAALAAVAYFWMDMRRATAPVETVGTLEDKAEISESQIHVLITYKRFCTLIVEGAAAGRYNDALQASLCTGDWYAPKRGAMLHTASVIPFPRRDI